MGKGCIELAIVSNAQDGGMDFIAHLLDIPFAILERSKVAGNLTENVLNGAHFGW